MKLKIGNKKFLLLFLLAIFCFGFLIFANNNVNLDDEYFYLIEKYSPNFLFDSEETYYPCDTTEFYYDNNFDEIPGQIAKQDYDNLLIEEKLDNFKIFYKVKEISNNEIVLQYWLFYIFNDFGNKHYGDGESVFVFVDKNTEKINRIIGSAHLGTKTKIVLANNELSNPKFEHINILVEKGSHANYIDGNNNGLVNVVDISNWYNAYGTFIQKLSWSEEDKLNGVKINYNDSRYKFVKLSELENKLQGKEKLKKSPELGAWPFTINDKTFYVSQIFKLVGLSGGGSGDFRGVLKVANNPESVRSITTELVFEKIDNSGRFLAQVFSNARNKISKDLQNGFSIFSGQVGSSGTTAPSSAGTVPAELGEKVLDINAIAGSDPAIADNSAITELTEKQKLAQIEKQVKQLREQIEFMRKRIEVAKYLQDKKQENEKLNTKNQNIAIFAINKTNKTSKGVSFVPVPGPASDSSANNTSSQAESGQHQNNDENGGNNGKQENADPEPDPEPEPEPDPEPDPEIDIIQPETIIEAGPENPSNSSTAIFEFLSTEENSTFECNLDENKWQECLSPVTFDGLSEDEHSFQVRATDEFENTDETPAIFGWEIFCQ